jgi:hypothetical protein
MGKYLYLSSADLNSDNSDEIVIGNNAGGINILNKGSSRLSTLGLFAARNINSIRTLVSPNPASDEIGVSAEADCSIAITDLLGNLVWQKSDLKKDIPETISINHLNQGFYFVKFMTADNKTSVQKLIVQK